MNLMKNKTMDVWDTAASLDILTQQKKAGCKCPHVPSVDVAPAALTAAVQLQQPRKQLAVQLRDAVPLKRSTTRRGGTNTLCGCPAVR